MLSPFFGVFGWNEGTSLRPVAGKAIQGRERRLFASGQPCSKRERLAARHLKRMISRRREAILHRGESPLKAPGVDQPALR